MKTKPNLFIVGEPKSGTTALASFLDQHPEIFISKPKEPHFFCSDFHEEARKFHNNSLNFFEFQKLNDYLRVYSEAKGEKILGEASTNYLYSKRSAKQLWKFNKKSKIIIMLREPVSFVHSLHMQYMNETAENEPNLRKAIELESMRKKGMFLPRRVRAPSYLYYRERVKYSEQINRYLRLFPKNQIKIIFFEDFKKNNSKVYSDIIDFLGVNNAFRPSFGGVHESKTPKSRIINLFFRSPYIKGVIKNILPPNKYDQIQLAVQKVIMKKQEKAPISDLLRLELMKEFKPEVIKLDKILRNKGFIEDKHSLIKEWGYESI